MPITASETVALQLEMMAGVPEQMFERDAALIKLFGGPTAYVPREPSIDLKELAALLGIEVPYYECDRETLERFIEFCSDWRTNPLTPQLWTAFDAGAHQARGYDYEDEL